VGCGGWGVGGVVMGRFGGWVWFSGGGFRGLCLGGGRWCGVVVGGGGDCVCVLRLGSGMGWGVLVAGVWKGGWVCVVDVLGGWLLGGYGLCGWWGGGGGVCWWRGVGCGCFAGCLGGGGGY